MDEKLLYPKYRFVIVTLMLITLGVACFATYITSPLLIFIAKSFSIEVANAGYSTTFTTLIGGVAMFGAAAIIGKFDIKKSMILAVFSLLIGNVITVIAPSFIIMLIGRALVGISFGLVGAAMGAVMSAWIPVKERTVVMTVNPFIAMGFITTAFVIAIPLTNAFGGSWTGPFVVCSIASAVILLAWIFIGKDNKIYNDYQKELRAAAATDAASNSQAAPAKENGLLLAIKRPDVWILTGLIALATIAGSAINIFLPTFLTTVRGLDPGTAATYTGFTTLAGMAGTFLGGALTTALGKRKPVIVPSIFLTAIGAFMIFGTSSVALTLAGIVLLGFGGAAIMPAAMVIITEVKNISPAAITGGYSFINGVGQVFSFFIPTIVALLSGIVGFANSMFVFAGMYVISAICSLLIKETGPKSKNKQSA